MDLNELTEFDCFIRVLNVLSHRKFNQLAIEIKRVNSNLTLSSEEKHNIAAAKQQVSL